MASAARGESSNPYGGGLGTGGKFRKPTARRSQKTPYDRPPTSVKNPGLGGGEDRGGGWLSKLVDPAQRLITYSAHRLFASVFRKRLVSGETPLQSPEQQQQLPERDVIQETKVGHRGNTSAMSMKNDVIQIQEANASGNPSKDGFTDLENMLKEKTFTRSEVDRLTTLLRSKAADSSIVNGVQRNEATIARHPASHVRDRAHPDDGIMNALVSTPLGSSRALDECIASPAQLAKAYMGSRPSEVTPMLGLRGQAGREDSVFLNKTHFPSKSPTMSLVPKLSGQRPLENGFVTPRSRGRSAVYSMARTPYSRPQSIVKNRSLFQASPSTWEESLSSGSRQGFQSGLKRRSSVLDNDIGSVGPVRRIRQKSNLSSRSLALPASESPLSVRASGGQNITHTSKDAGDIPGSNFNLVPSKSREMSVKIFQHIDKMVLTKEKSPSKLSPSMLRGPALKSLQNVEAPNLLDNLPEENANLLGSSHQKQSREAGSLALSEKTGGAADDTSKAGSSKDQETRVKGAYLPLSSSLEEHPPKKRAFRMIADEDFLELDDDHGGKSTPFEEAEKQNVLKVEKGFGISVPKGEKQHISYEAIVSTSYIPNGNAFQSTSNGSLEIGKSQFSALPIQAVQQSNTPFESTSTFIQGTEKSSISPAKPTLEGEDFSGEEPKKAAAVFSNTFSSPVATDILNQNTGASADIKLEKRSSSAFGVKPTELKKTVSNSAFGAESTASAESTLKSSIFSGGSNAISQPQINGSHGVNPSFPPSISNIPSNNSVSEVPCTVQSFAATPAASSVFVKLPANISNDSNSGSNLQSTPAPPLSSTSSSIFGEPAPAPFSASTVSAFSCQISKETEVKDPTFGNINSFKFSGMASADTADKNAFAATTSEIKSTPGFVFESASPAVADAGKNISDGTSSAVGGSILNPSSTASSVPGNSGSLVFGVTSSSTPTPTPGTETSKFSGIFAATTGSNPFGTSSPALTNSGSNPFAASTASSGFAFNAVLSASAGSSQSQASNLFGAATAQTGNTGSGTTTSTQSAPFTFPSFASAQTGNTVCGTTSTQSAPFMFASSASAPSFGLSGNNTSSNNSPFGLSKSEPIVFASGSTPQLSSTNSSASSSGTTSSSVFGTNWQAPNSAPAFASSFTTSSSPTFLFGGSSAGTGSSASAPITFGFNSTSPAIPQQPVFGNSNPSATPSQSLFGNSTPGFGFGANAPPPNTNGFNNNQQMSMEDSMAEDTDQANKASMVQQPMFGQQPVSMPQPSFGFGGAPATPPPLMANPFQFGGQPIASTPQNVSPFQASQSLEFQGGGSFSLGSTGGGDKSGRRIFKAKKTNRKK